MGYMNSDHRDNIFDSAKSRTDSLRAALDHESGYCVACSEGRCEWQDDSDYCPTNDEFLDVEVFVSQNDRERTITTFLLGCGGPTTRVTVDQWDTVSFFHSWGKDSCGVDLTTIELFGDQADVWLQAAEWFTGIYV